MSDRDRPGQAPKGETGRTKLDFRCERCEKQFKNDEELRAHVDLVHEAGDTVTATRG